MNACVKVLSMNACVMAVLFMSHEFVCVMEAPSTNACVIEVLSMNSCVMEA